MSCSRGVWPGVLRDTLVLHWPAKRRTKFPIGRSACRAGAARRFEKGTYLHELLPYWGDSSVLAPASHRMGLRPLTIICPRRMVEYSFLPQDLDTRLKVACEAYIQEATLRLLGQIVTFLEQACGNSSQSMKLCPCGTHCVGGVYIGLTTHVGVALCI
jgi:hypothetical protein